MIIAIPKETKTDEYRVSITPTGVKQLTRANHRVIVESQAGSAVGFQDTDYQYAGAEISHNIDQLFIDADMIVKVKEPQPDECKRLKSGQILFTYLHLAANPDIAHLLLDSGAVCIAYETISDDDNHFPLLQPMSEIAGKLAVLSGAYALEKPHDGRGVLLTKTTGVPKAKVLVLGGGVVGTNAAKLAFSIGASVCLLDRHLSDEIKNFQHAYPDINIQCLTQAVLLEYLAQADLVIGAVSIAGAKTPKLINKAMLKTMQKGAVLVDVAIDQGGCFETSRPTTHQSPTFVVDGIVHYCVSNMPSAVATTATIALTNQTLPFVLMLANQGYQKALLNNPHLANGLHIIDGKITYTTLASALKMDYYPYLRCLQS